MAEPYRYSIIGSEQPVVPKDWVVGDLIAAGHIFGIIGKPASGKSFGAVEMAIAVAIGGRWFNFECTRGSVVYIANERRMSVHGRISAGREARCGKIAQSAEIVVVQDPVLLICENEWVERLKTTIQKVESETATKVRLVVLDTLSASIPGLDENSAAVCSALMAGLRAVAEGLGLAVGLVHHCNVSEGPRGSSALLAAFDVQFSFKPVNRRFRVEVTKSSDGPTGATFDFSLEPFGDDGSVVARLIRTGPAADEATSGGGARRRSSGIDWEPTVLSAIQQLAAENGVTSRAAVLQELRSRQQDQPGVNDATRRKGLERAINSLADTGQIKVEGNLLRLSEEKLGTNPCDNVCDETCDSVVTDHNVAKSGTAEAPVTERDRAPKGPVSQAMSQGPRPPGRAPGTDIADSARNRLTARQSPTAPPVSADGDHGSATGGGTGGKSKKPRHAIRPRETDQPTLL